MTIAEAASRVAGGIMVKYIGTHDLQAFIAHRSLPVILGELLGYLREDYLRWPQFDKTARVASHSPLGVIELMPIADARLYAFKYVNGHPGNTAHGRLTVTAFGVLANVADGYPRLLSELTITTALRTAATSALAAQALARPGSKSMAIIGNGAQSEFQILAFKALLGIREVRAYDIDPAATQKLVRNLASVSDLRVIAAASAHEAVRGADIVTTVTADKANATILMPDMIEHGMHVNAVGGDCPGKTELHADILSNARVIVEFEPQTRIEGEIQQMPADFPVTELWQVLSGRTPGRQNEQQVTVFDSVGFALEDFSALRYVNDLAESMAIGTRIDLVPMPGNPKDLYQYVAPELHACAMHQQRHETAAA